MDVNDNVPEWSMVPAPYLAVVPPDAPAGSLVYKLHAQDGDEGNNGEVEYFLSDGRVSFFSLIRCFCTKPLNVLYLFCGCSLPFRIIVLSSESGGKNLSKLSQNGFLKAESCLLFY